jgi:hypothetical protein
MFTESLPSNEICSDFTIPASGRNVTIFLLERKMFPIIFVEKNILHILCMVNSFEMIGKKGAFMLWHLRTERIRRNIIT